jgi:hypothetical protein
MATISLVRNCEYQKIVCNNNLQQLAHRKRLPFSASIFYYFAVIVVSFDNKNSTRYDQLLPSTTLSFWHRAVFYTPPRTKKIKGKTRYCPLPIAHCPS